MRRPDDAGLSAVMATLLLVIVIVALAVGVAYMGYEFVKGREVRQPKLIGMAEVEGEPAVRVIKVDTEMDWARDVRTSGTCEPLLNGMQYPITEGTAVKAGDVLTCEAGEQLSVLHKGKNGDTLLYSFHF